MNAPAPAEPPQLRLLGRAGVTRGGAWFDIPDVLPGYLLAYLGARGDWVARDELAALFWPEAGSEDAQRNLRVTLNRLRDRLLAWGLADGLASERRRLRWLPGSDLAELRAARQAGRWQAVADAVGQPFASTLAFGGQPVLQEWADTERRVLLALQREAVLRCHPGQAPAAAAELAARHLALDAHDEDVLRLRLQALAALGRHDEARHAFRAFDQRLRAELGVGASAALAAAAARLAGGEAPATPAAASLVGREAELQALQSALVQHRLVTLCGLGGVGKSRLARAAAERRTHTLWLRLDEGAGADALAHQALRLLGAPASVVRDPLAAAGARLAAAATELLVLDNAEALLLHDRSGAYALLDAWFAAAPGLSVLATSRQPLGHAGERVLALHSLALPAGGPPLAAPAVQLLVAEARRAVPGFDPQPHAAELAAIARQVGGLPLALRIAAMWLRQLQPAEITGALQPHLIAEHEIGVALRQTWQLLPADEREALTGLSLLAAAAAADWAVSASGAALQVLLRLAERGLLENQPAPDGATRWALHPLVRAFAAQRLAEQPAAERAAHEQHAHAVLARLRPWTHWRQVDQRAALLAIGELLPDALAAWRWAVAGGRAEFIAEAAPVLLNYFERLGRWAEGTALFEAAEAGFDSGDTGELAALAALARGRALLLYRDGRYDAAEALARRGLAWARQLGHREGCKANLNTLCLALWMLGRLPEALQVAEEGRALADADGDRAGHAVFGGNLALLHKKLGAFAAAEAAWRDALAVHREVGNWVSAVTTLNNLGNLLRTLQRLDESVALLEESLRLCDAYGFASSRPFALINLALTHLAAGRLDAARALAEQAHAEVQASGERMLQAATQNVLAELALRRGDTEGAAAWLVPALRGARAIGDVANLLEALAGYARWCGTQGDETTAAQVLATLHAHPALHAELRESLPPAPPAVAPGDVTALVETACAALAAHGGDPASRQGTGAAGP